MGTNRDEMADRPWLAPARHWPDRSNVVAGLDQQAGGSWLGMNDAGMVAAINNRAASLAHISHQQSTATVDASDLTGRSPSSRLDVVPTTPAPSSGPSTPSDRRLDVLATNAGEKCGLGAEQGKRSRGELVLEALDHDTATDAAEALRHLNPMAYRPFNLLIADAGDAFWLRHLGPEETDRIDVFPVPQGISMLTAYDLNDSRCRRTQTYLPRFNKAKTPQPANDDWEEWEALFSSRDSYSNADAAGAMRIITESGFNTVSSSLIALPAKHLDWQPKWRFARRYTQCEPYQKIV